MLKNVARTNVSEHEILMNFPLSWFLTDFHQAEDINKLFPCNLIVPNISTDLVDELNNLE